MADRNISVSHPLDVVLLGPNKDCKADDDILYKDSLSIFVNHRSSLYNLWLRILPLLIHIYSSLPIRLVVQSRLS